MRKTKSLVLGGIAISLASTLVKAGVLYTSGGFETTSGFTLTGGVTPGGFPGGPSLYDQSTSNLPSFGVAPGSANPNGATLSFASIETTAVYAGSQAVKFARTAGDGDTYYYPQLNYTATTSSVVDISWAMNVSSSQTSVPLFGIEAFNGNDTLGLGGVDASSGKIVYLNSAGQYVETAGVALNAWNTFDLQLNYGTQSDTLYVNGSPIETSRFASGLNETGFTDADIASIASNQTTDSAVGTAYYDNYLITTAVPEPGSVTMIVLACGAVLSRRAKRRPE